MPLNPQLLKGSVSLMLLSLLSASDMYGYEMIKALTSMSNNVFDFKEGTLYPVLHELEKGRFIDSYWEQGAGKRKRKYYHITTKGTMCLTEKQEDWAAFTQAVNQVLKGAAYV